MRKILFEWNFFGDDAEGTAKHHLVHLKQFLEKENIASEKQEFKKVDDALSLAMMIISEEDARKIKNVLKPHRAYIVG